MPEPRAIVFLDFDGTISAADATDAVLDAFADADWHRIEDEWLAGRIGSRECLRAQMALVHARRDEVDRLLDGIGVDPGFERLLDVCASHATPVHVISDGFDYCIRRILGRPGLGLQDRLTHSRIVSSSLVCDAGHWRATFTHPAQPCVHGCATCKPAAMAHLNPDGLVTVFVGDGRSDRHAAAHADFVFAKDTLATLCEDASIPYAPFDTLAAVATRLDHLLRSGLPTPRSLPGKASSAP